MKSINILTLLSLFLYVSCGGSSGGDNDPQMQEYDERAVAEAEPGTYYTVLRPVNIQSNGFIPYGMATFSVQNDNLQVNISVDDDQPVTHRQYLHMGNRCPSMADDLNRDGFVDYAEAQRVVGPVIMPLDGDLNSIEAGAEQFPRGRAMTYFKQARLSKMKLQGSVVLVHGTTHQNFFPASLASYKDEPAHLSLPIVCGVLKKIN